MKLTRERKIVGTVLVIALVGLGYDQLNSTPADDAAQYETGGGQLLLASTSGASNKSHANQLNVTDGVSLASRLSALATKTGASTPEQMRDAFRPVEGWFNKPVVASTATGPTISPAEKFAADHKLTATSLNTAGGSVAVVDGTLLHVGASLDGYRLISVTRTTALFESSDGARAQLKLPIAASPASAAAR